MDTLQRRRLGALAIVVLFIGFGFAVNGWQYSPIKWLLEVDEVTAGTFTAGDPYDEWVYTYCDGDEQQVLVLQDGRLHGAEALDRLRRSDSPERCDLPLADHPELARWDDLLARLQDVTQSPGATGRDVVNAALALPLSSLYLKPVESWITSDPNHAVDYLDALAIISPDPDEGLPDYTATRRDNMAATIDVALKQVKPNQLEPGQLDRWLSADLFEPHREWLISLALMSETTLVGKARLLEELDEIDNDRQLAVYRELAPPLVADPQYAALLVEQLDELPRDERHTAANFLLAQDGVSDEFVRELLNEFDEVFYGGAAELDAFITIANNIKDRPNAPRQLATVLEDLADVERRKAAIYLVSLDDAESDLFTLNVLQHFDELHTLSQPKVMDAIFASRQFERPAVQQACLDVLQYEMNRAQRREYLAKLLLHQGLDEGVEARARIALAD